MLHGGNGKAILNPDTEMSKAAQRCGMWIFISVPETGPAKGLPGSPSSRRQTNRSCFIYTR